MGGPDEPGDAAEPATHEEAARRLRSARRRRRVAALDPFEVLYRVYLSGISLTVAVLLAAGATGDRRLTAAQLVTVHRSGAAAVGVAVALAVALGIRSGASGGPLVVEAADVRHVLLAPVDRATVLRPLLWRQLRTGLALGTGLGALAGLLAGHRFPHPQPAWVASGAACGLCAGILAYGAGLLVSGRRLPRWSATALAMAVLAWSAFDLTGRRVSSPATWTGQLALSPLHLAPTSGAALVVAGLILAAGVASLGRVSLEAADRRAVLVGQLRFAATLQDVRTVIVLRRALAQERPRQRPWLRLPRTLNPTRPPGPSPGRAAGGRGRRRRPVWRRSWHGILRWPAARVARVATLGGLAGASAVAAWNGNTPLIVVAGLCLYVAALDAVEPLAQDLDHPDRELSVPHPAGLVHLRQLAPPAVVMVACAAGGWLVALALTGFDRVTVEVGAIMGLPAALAAVGGAAISVIKGPPPAMAADVALMPEAAGARAMVRLLWPPAVAVLGLLPLLAGRSALRHHQALVPALANATQGVVFLCVLVGAWVRFQEEAHEWWSAQTAAARPSAGRTDDGSSGPAGAQPPPGP